VDSVLEPASPRVSDALDAPDKASLGARARVTPATRAPRDDPPEGDLETRAFALALTEYPYAKGVVYSGSAEKRNHPTSADGW
jgi:hypothetical protein